MAKKKGMVTLIKMKSEESPHYYTTRKNRKNVSEKIELMKYDPVVRKHVKYKEAKLS